MLLAIQGSLSFMQAALMGGKSLVGDFKGELFMEKQRKTRTLPEQEKPSSGRRLHGAALVSVVGALFFTLLLEALDQTIVSTAMPRIASSLHGFDRYAWVVTAY